MTSGPAAPQVSHLETEQGMARLKWTWLQGVKEKSKSIFTGAPRLIIVCIHFTGIKKMLNTNITLLLLKTM